MSTNTKRYSITVASKEKLHDITARLQGLGAKVVKNLPHTNRVIAEIGLESTIQTMKDMGAIVERYKE